MQTYQPISCELHDYVEIACLYAYDLRIEFVDDRTSLVARAITTRIKNQEEFLIVEDNGVDYDIRLDRLSAITPLNANRRFDRILLRANTAD